MMTTETAGWGGDARKNHWIDNGVAICGRTGPMFTPTIYECYTFADADRHPEQYCQLCRRAYQRMVDAWAGPEGPGGA